MEIRNATEEDIEAIADIYRTYVRTSVATLEQHEPSTEAVRNEFGRIFAIKAPFIVAIDSSTGKLCAYAYTGPFNERSGYQYTCEDSIYIHPDHCGKGLGKKMLNELLQQQKATSKTTQVIAKMSILPEQGLEDVASCRLHTAFGFKRVGRLARVGYKFDKWIDVVIMQAELQSI